MGEKLLFQVTKERRRHRRVETNLFMTYFFPGREPRDAGVFISKNVSGGGILFESVKKIPVGTLLDLLIHLPTSPVPLSAKGKVVRVNQIRPYGRFDIGLSLVDILEKDRKELIQYLVSTLFTRADCETLFRDEAYWKNIFEKSELKEVEAIL